VSFSPTGRATHVTDGVTRSCVGTAARLSSDSGYRPGVCRRSYRVLARSLLSRRGVRSTGVARHSPPTEVVSTGHAHHQPTPAFFAASSPPLPRCSTELKPDRALRDGRLCWAGRVRASAPEGTPCVSGAVMGREGRFHGREAPVGDRVLLGRQGGRRRERRNEQRDRGEQPPEHDGSPIS
jgi:hypothetical protein